MAQPPPPGDFSPLLPPASLTVTTEPGPSQAIFSTSSPYSCKEGPTGKSAFRRSHHFATEIPDQGVIFLSFSAGKQSSLEVPSGATLGLPELLF